MKTKIIILITAIAGVLFAGCRKDMQYKRASCDRSNSEFKQLYSGLAAKSEWKDFIFLDTEVHEYSFEVSAQKEICAIGY